MLNEDDVNMSGTGKIDGRLLPTDDESKIYAQNIFDKLTFYAWSIYSSKHQQQQQTRFDTVDITVTIVGCLERTTYLVVDSEYPD